MIKTLLASLVLLTSVNSSNQSMQVVDVPSSHEVIVIENGDIYSYYQEEKTTLQKGDIVIDIEGVLIKK